MSKNTQTCIFQYDGMPKYSLSAKECYQSKEKTYYQCRCRFLILFGTNYIVEPSSGSQKQNQISLLSLTLTGMTSNFRHLSENLLWFQKSAIFSHTFPIATKGNSGEESVFLLSQWEKYEKKWQTFGTTEDFHLNAWNLMSSLWVQDLREKFDSVFEILNLVQLYN